MADSDGTVYPIVPIEGASWAAFCAYLEDQCWDNGRGETPLFMPLAHGAPALTEEKATSMRAALDVPLGGPGWRRFWTARDANGDHVGHVDLRAVAAPCSSHRAQLGMGVHRDHRRRGLGRTLMEHALAWALRETALEWIDLSVLGGNAQARELYRKLGFVVVATIEDAFRVDGVSVDDVLMTRRIR